jgi:thiol-disulfide isomerase/thioredoxin
VFGTVLVVAAVLIIVLVSVVGKTKSSGAFGTIPAPASVTNAITKVPSASFTEAGSNVTASGPYAAAIHSLKGQPPLIKDGKPYIVYVGSEWCPYCAATRWPLIVALARFGTFKGLHMTASSKTDIYPSTHTMSFYGSSFKSRYIAFSGTEECTDVPTTSQSLPARECNGYEPLSTITTSLAKLFNKYDFPPYVSATPPTPGGIPFVDFANKYHEDGAIMDPTILAGLTQAQIATSMANPLSSPAQTTLVTANYYTAYICKVDKNQPGSVCHMPVVRQAAKALNL